MAGEQWDDIPVTGIEGEKMGIPDTYVAFNSWPIIPSLQAVVKFYPSQALISNFPEVSQQQVMKHVVTEKSRAAPSASFIHTTITPPAHTTPSSSIH
jgi:hypothetical protein